MRLSTIFVGLFFGCYMVVCQSDAGFRSDSGYDLWLKYHKMSNPVRLREYQQIISSIIVKGESKTCQIIRAELKKGLDGLLGVDIPVNDSIKVSGSILVGTSSVSHIVREYCPESDLKTLGQEGYIIRSLSHKGQQLTVIAANHDKGLLYGAYHFLRLVQTHKRLENLNIIRKPKIKFRLLNHWANLDGTIERGYAGSSLWKWDELPEQLDVRYEDYARANASIGINGTVLNNVNATAKILRPSYIRKVAKLADVFRPYGIKVYLSINFHSPLSPPSVLGKRRGGIGHLSTADPLDSEVRIWWKNKVSEIYRSIPDFGGFLVKANSEGMPGPQSYDRTHADGANMLAEALKPHGGIVMWRAFVYNADTDPDRAKRAYKEFVPLDGQFNTNVFVQAKNGPIDFQPREPVQPLFGAMPKTPLMLELQITQEYLGHSTHLVYLAPMWQEYLEFDTYAEGEGCTLKKIVDGSLHNYPITGTAGVSNIGSDINWTGHFFAQANWYAFGRLAWDHSLTSDEIAEEWIRMSISNDSEVVEKVKFMMMGSWEACVNYMTPLGLHHIMQYHVHYGPGPDIERAPRADWTSVYYHKADSSGIGFDRSSTGSNAVSQYYRLVRDVFNSLNTCPEKYLLWFHHVNWDHTMVSGRSLWEELCDHYISGTGFIDEMILLWSSLEKKIDGEVYQHVKNKLEKQKIDATIWRNTCLRYFQKYSRYSLPDIIE